jgi:hypothetical protein
LWNDLATKGETTDTEPFTRGDPFRGLAHGCLLVIKHWAGWNWW